MFLSSSYNYNAVIALNVASAGNIDRAVDMLGEDRALKSELGLFWKNSVDKISQRGNIGGKDYNSTVSAALCEQHISLSLQPLTPPQFFFFFFCFLLNSFRIPHDSVLDLISSSSFPLHHFICCFICQTIYSFSPPYEFYIL